MLTKEQRLAKIIEINTSNLDPKSKISALEEFVKQEKAEEEQAKQSKSAQKVEITNEPNFVSQLLWSMLRGEPGHTPTDEELIALIEPLIPEPIKGDDGGKGQDGKTPTKSELVKIIKPLIPKPLKGDKGDSPSDEELMGLIRPLIPEPLKGEDGKPVEADTLANLVLEKLKADKLHIKNFDGVNELQDRIVEHAVTQARGLLYAGLFDNKIKAGTNITVSTSPDGTVTINSTGGGTGFTKLDATGTVDGTNAAFTFTQKPTYIISDGAWYVENNGWTWSGTTATMSVPPQTGIFGFV